MFYKVPSNVADDESSEPAFKLPGQQASVQQSPIKVTSKKGILVYNYIGDIDYDVILLNIMSINYQFIIHE